ncbi:ABC transporter ATP-binding protein [Undibacterium cyanobacteriorum]|uniref:ABC transporter ATP-binding protein n=1 Tax=Undibacterium cyanobacteriorum TaxID=3073561 RepID=A0ABY9RGC2_9BURK|nr:ABC transporter ATP-binding protein [Undibacterium sp. 20NA77.5]WMW79287.1 ABC transporter ATP-binding protein [Undibacterium sp. 20NA77.5]
MNQATHVLRTEGLRLSAGKRALAHSLDWQVQVGECWCVIGRNGAGKSTLLKTLAGLREIENGAVFFNSKALSDWDLFELARLRAYLPQGRVDAFAYRALETVLSARHPYQDSHFWESNDDLDIALAAMRLLDVEDLAQRDVRSLSGGERQRVAIAALLAQDAQIMLLDEPANALDLAHQVSVMQILSEQCHRFDKAVVMVSHDINLAYQVATHVLLMMPHGETLLGLKQDVMTAANLSACLGHPIERFEHGKQTLFMPSLGQ